MDKRLYPNSVKKLPQNPDLYAIGALLFQMTQLRPFTRGWLRELSVSPTFSQLRID